MASSVCMTCSRDRIQLHYIITIVDHLYIAETLSWSNCCTFRLICSVKELRSFKENCDMNYQHHFYSVQSLPGTVFSLVMLSLTFTSEGDMLYRQYYVGGNNFCSGSDYHPQVIQTLQQQCMQVCLMLPYVLNKLVHLLLLNKTCPSITLIELQIYKLKC